MAKVAIIGGCGRIGLRLALIAANKGHNVLCIDIDDEKINEINIGAAPFIEQGADLFLEEALKKKTLVATSENSLVKDAKVIVITIGTPVDSNLNASIEPVAGTIFDLIEYLNTGQLIVFRNVLYPGIVKRIKTLIEDKSGLKVGKDLYLAFAPESLGETTNINDLLGAPQPIGVFENNSFNVAKEFFETITKGKITELSPEEALLTKLMNNMYSYVQSAIANEFYLIAQGFGANINKILEASYNKRDTKDLRQIPQPNPNAAGPGMHKEGWFLVDRVPFGDLVTTAFKINESMPNQIVQMLENHKVNKVVILGMANRANLDDPRSSLGYKLRRALYYQDYQVACYDPYLPEYSDSSVLNKADAVILMTPHDEFRDLEKIKNLTNNNDLLVIDILGFWKETQELSQNGLFKVNQKSQRQILTQKE